MGPDTGHPQAARSRPWSSLSRPKPNRGFETRPPQAPAAPQPPAGGRAPHRWSSPTPVVEPHTGGRACRDPDRVDCPETTRPPAHPTELTDPCCLPALGELGEMPPHGGLGRV